MKPSRAARKAEKAIAFVPPVRVEIARSFSYKLQCETHGGPRYESRDFFCSEKSECSIEDAAAVSAALYQFCKAQVLEAVREYIADMRKQKGAA